MKILAKTKAKLLETKAESMAEVIVAFLVLSLVMALFAQGLRYATSVESYSKANTVNNDNSMIKLQNVLAGKEEENVSRPEDPQNRPLPGQENALKLSQYFVVTGHDTNVYWVFDVGNSTDAGDSGDEG